MAKLDFIAPAETATSINKNTTRPTNDDDDSVYLMSSIIG